MARTEKKYHYIYKITCNITNKYYIGMHSTNNLEDGYFGSGKRLWFSINYHGKENHVKDILEFLPNRQLLKEREEKIVNQHLLNEPLCMNLVIGGQGGGFVNEEHFIKFQTNGSKAGNKAFKYKLENDLVFRESLSKNRSENSKKAMIDGRLKSVNKSYDWTGKKHSDQTKQKISELKIGTGTGETNSQYGTCWITKEGTNKKIKKEDLQAYLNEGWVKGRFTNIKGELVKNSKLTNDDVLKIKELIYKNELSQSKLGKMFNVKQETISKIKRGLTYKDT